MSAEPTQPTETRNEWKETVRDIFDTLYFGEDNCFTGNRLARRIIKLIEQRHHDYFCGQRREASDTRAVPRRP